jgi:hypothetical protein
MKSNWLNNDERFKLKPEDLDTDKKLAKRLKTSFYEKDFVYTRCPKCDNGCMGYIGPQISICDKPTTSELVKKTDYSTVAGMEELFERVWKMAWWDDFWEKKGPIPYSPILFRSAVVEYIMENFNAFSEVCVWRDSISSSDKTKAEDILEFPK